MSRFSWVMLVLLLFSCMITSPTWWGLVAESSAGAELLARASSVDGIAWVIIILVILGFGRWLNRPQKHFW